MQLDNIPATIKTTRAMKAFILSRSGIYVLQKPRQFLALIYYPGMKKMSETSRFTILIQFHVSCTPGYLQLIRI